jgi:hypothetical protein
MRRDDGKLISAKAFAGRLGVSHSVVYRAIATGRVKAYCRDGNPLRAGARGAKFVRPAEAERQWREGRAMPRRGEDEPTLIEARRRKLAADAALLEIRLAQRRRELIPKAEAITTMEFVGRSVQSVHKSIVMWAEESQIGGLPAVSGLLRVLIYASGPLRGRRGNNNQVGQ